MADFEMSLGSAGPHMFRLVLKMKLKKKNIRPAITFCTL